MIEMHAIFKGKVQGVGFRWTVVDVAEQFSLKGTVQNLPNGSVEVVAQGTKEELTQFLSEVKKNCGAARIEKVDVKFRKSERVFQGFKIL